MHVTQFPRIGQFQSRRNFPKLSSRKRTEQLFVIGFAKFLKRNLGRGKSFIVREFSMNGFGVADLACLMLVKSKKNRNGSSTKRRYLTAYEMKMADWKKGLAQAFRYKYFAHRAIVILPPSEAANASKQISVFRKLGIGLWAFDKVTGYVGKYFTPPYRKAKYPYASRKAIMTISRLSESS